MRSSRSIVIALLVILGSGVTGCSPEVGSEAWCEDMKETPRGDWSANQAAAFAKSCVFK